MKRMPDETMRRFRIGNIRGLMMWRCGRVLPDDDAGREYLTELLIAISLGSEPAPGMFHAIKDHAPWMSDDEALGIVADVLTIPAAKRRVTARELGERLNVTNDERERLHLWTIKPADMTDKDLAAFKKAKHCERMRRRRQARGAAPRQQYEATSLSRTKPWQAKNISRRTWERRRAASACAISTSLVVTDLRQGGVTHGRPPFEKGAHLQPPRLPGMNQSNKSRQAGVISTRTCANQIKARTCPNRRPAKVRAQAPKSGTRSMRVSGRFTERSPDAGK